jgi:hypothetical protein
MVALTGSEVMNLVWALTFAASVVTGAAVYLCASGGERHIPSPRPQRGPRRARR